MNMNMKDFFSKIRGGKNESKVEQNERETEMSNININLTPLELNFTSLCVKTLGTLLKERPDELKDTGNVGIMFQFLSKMIDMPALFAKFDTAMMMDMMGEFNSKN